MVPILHPDIWRNIIRQACGDDDGTDDYSKKRQATLTNLTYVSRLFYQLSTTELYKDCLVKNSEQFFGGLDKLNPHKLKHLTNIETLRFCHDTEYDLDPAYFRTMKFGAICWKLCGTKWYPSDHSFWSRWLVHRIDIERKEIGISTMEISKAMNKGLDVLPRLKRVVMMGDEDDQEGEEVFEQSIVDHLIGLRNVKYYCQTSIFGHLSLANAMYWPLHPPQVVTSHISRNKTHLWAFSMQIPIIVGATNRYVCDQPVDIGGFAPLTVLDVTEDLVGLFDRLLGFPLRSRGIVTRQVMSDPESGEKGSDVEMVPFEAVSLDDTSIELYNFASNRVLAPTTGLPTGDTFPIASEVLKAIEQRLGNRLGNRLGSWKGKVKHFNLADTPPCPACGKLDTTSVDE